MSAVTGYVYNAPNIPINRPSNQPTNSYPLYNFPIVPPNPKNHYKENEFRSNEYLKQNYLQNNNGLGNPSYITGHSSNGYTGYNQAFTPLIPFNNNYAHANFQHAASPIRAGGNVDYIQALPSPTNSNINFNNGATYSSSYTQPSTGVNQNIGYAHTSTASGNNNDNNGNSKAYASSAQKNIYPQPWQPIGGHNVQSNFVSTSTNAGALNNGNMQTSNAAYSYSGYGHNVTPPRSNLNNGYTVVPTSSTSNLIHHGYETTGQSISLPVSGFSVSNKYEQSFTSSSSSNFKTRYEQTSTSTGVNGGFVLSQIPNTSGNSNNEYSQPPTGPTHIDLNSDLSVSSTSSNSNSGTIQKGLDRVVNNGDTNSQASSLITPIIHKHIYFHVPPPEIEETGKIIPPILRKKNYKILFIKTPLQESKSNLARLQEQMQNAAIEDKTLIYVLVKKPEEPKPVVLPIAKPSDHQVFFVKYNESPFDIAARVNEELDKTGSINSIVPLEPGLANGRHK